MGGASEDIPSFNVTARRKTSIAELNCRGNPGGVRRALSIFVAGAKRRWWARLVFPTVTDTSCSANSCSPVPLCWSLRCSLWHVERQATGQRTAAPPSFIMKEPAAARLARRFRPRIVRRDVVGKSSSRKTGVSGPGVSRTVGPVTSDSDTLKSEDYVSRVLGCRTANSWHATGSCVSKGVTAGRVRNRLNSPAGSVLSRTNVPSGRTAAVSTLLTSE